ncbi:hypothetical protein [Methanobrevibacter boviskoreani]|uniref:hypothetical protein n=1 Tax=Methanobrevibacter boviskoreani TaxID=1348249 RepID=UPI0023F351FE|nr:hypothetical protein [Methanobrevibacter boviskoreani]MDD6257099.1 hypothetical protein [Methanobrevibacter boviskoreani]
MKDFKDHISDDGMFNLKLDFFINLYKLELISHDLFNVRIDLIKLDKDLIENPFDTGIASRIEVDTEKLKEFKEIESELLAEDYFLRSEITDDFNNRIMHHHIKNQFKPISRSDYLKTIDTISNKLYEIIEDIYYIDGEQQILEGELAQLQTGKILDVNIKEEIETRKKLIKENRSKLKSLITGADGLYKDLNVLILRKEVSDF